MTVIADHRVIIARARREYIGIIKRRRRWQYTWRLRTVGV